MVSGVTPIRAFNAFDAVTCLGVCARYCPSSVEPNGVEACEIIKLSNGKYQCNIYGSTFSVSLLANSPNSKVYLKKSKSFMII